MCVCVFMHVCGFALQQWSHCFLMGFFFNLLDLWWVCEADRCWIPIRRAVSIGMALSVHYAASSQINLYPCASFQFNELDWNKSSETILPKQLGSFGKWWHVITKSVHLLRIRGIIHWTNWGVCIVTDFQYLVKLSVSSFMYGLEQIW